jgi:hypothetical protein
VFKRKGYDGILLDMMGYAGICWDMSKVYHEYGDIFSKYEYDSMFEDGIYMDIPCCAPKWLEHART